MHSHVEHYYKALAAQLHTTHMPLLMATIAFGLGRRWQSSPQWRYLHHFHTTLSCILIW